jgi:hypothetical protein
MIGIKQDGSLHKCFGIRIDLIKRQAPSRGNCLLLQRRRRPGTVLPHLFHLMFRLFSSCSRSYHGPQSIKICLANEKFLDWLNRIAADQQPGLF